MEVFQSTKVIDGFSTCFRQWKASETHCSFIHGYSISFKVTFEGPLDERNWVADFGFLKRSKTSMYSPRWWNESTGAGPFSPGDWFKDMFDHTMVVAADDPQLGIFKILHDSKTLQLRILPAVGCEMFAKFVYEKLSEFICDETDGRVKIVSVECFEHSKNSAIYSTDGISDSL